VPGSYGAILADAMGLGKTLQSISLVWTLLHSSPYSATPSRWLEFYKWLPWARSLLDSRMLYCVGHEGARPEDYRGQAVLLISYEMLLRWAARLSEHSFDLLICDEGHRLKNAATQTAQALAAVGAKRRIVLTGTPVQNDLDELYTLVDFVSPGRLGNWPQFRAAFVERIAAAADSAATEDQLDKGRAAAENLPPKRELVIFCRPSDLQRRLFDVVCGCAAAVEVLSDELGHTARLADGEHLRLIGLLRKVASDPAFAACASGRCNLPPKRELVIFCRPSDLQRRLFDVVSSASAATERSDARRRGCCIGSSCHSGRHSSARLVRWRLHAPHAQAAVRSEVVPLRSSAVCCMRIWSLLSRLIAPMVAPMPRGHRLCRQPAAEARTGNLLPAVRPQRPPIRRRVRLRRRRQVLSDELGHTARLADGRPAPHRAAAQGGQRSRFAHAHLVAKETPVQVLLIIHNFPAIPHDPPEAASRWREGRQQQKNYDDLSRQLMSEFPLDFDADGGLNELIDDNLVATSSSGKLSVTSHLLQRICRGRRRNCVLASNSTKTLDLLGRLCAALGLASLRLDGATPTATRQRLVDQFNDTRCVGVGGGRVLLLSTKAGGVGLNLTGASDLILFDIDWNPANDAQATARIWREGQRRPCSVYRLLTAGSIEERIFLRQVKKLGLSRSILDSASGAASALISGANGSKKSSTPRFTRQELAELFTFVGDTDCLAHDCLNCRCLGSGGGDDEQPAAPPQQPPPAPAA
uniref:Helicase ATP-binding domain-containing protein n=1 Tax=Macrostomum lignano TaxID=282301 RepID=A0A1I8IJG2_9PLAT